MSTISNAPVEFATDAPDPGAPIDDRPWPPTDLPSEDGENLESDWHRLEMTLLIDCVRQHYLGRSDFYVGGNMFIHFSAEQVRNLDFRGPDFFFVKGVDGTRIRDYWATWLEGGKYPDVIIELLSPSTRREDLGKKKTIYQDVFRTPEYFCYDPNTKELRGWRLNNGMYEAIAPDKDGRLECRELGLALGNWIGLYGGFETNWPRFFDAKGNVAPTAAEAKELRAEEERQRADAEAIRAETERQRADSLEAEVARLRAQLKANQ